LTVSSRTRRSALPETRWLAELANLDTTADLDARHPLASVTASSRLAASTSQLGGGADLTERGPVQDRLGGIDDAVAMPATKPAHAALAALSVPGTHPAGW
jgi:hypothetical protein